MKKLYVLTILLATLVTAGCAGTDFTRLEGEQVVFGVDSPESIKAKLGNPFQEGVVTKNDNQFKTMSYAYSSTTGDSAYKGVIASRGQGFYFYKDRLVGSDFSSTWAIDSTDFDGEKVSLIKKGATSKDEVIALLGEPGGEYIYPLIATEEEKAVVYLYSQTKGSAFSLEFLQKLLVIHYDSNGVVTNIEYTQIGEQ